MKKEFNGVEVGFLFGISYFIVLPVFALNTVVGYNIDSANLYGSWKSYAFNETATENVQLLLILLFLVCQLILFVRVTSRIKRKEVKLNDNYSYAKLNLKTYVLTSVSLYLLSTFTFNLPRFILQGSWHESLHLAKIFYGSLIGGGLKFLSLASLVISGWMLISLYVERKKIIFLFIYFSLPLIEMITSGNRIYLLVFIVGYLFLLISNRNLKAVLKLSALSLPLVIVSNVWSQIRGSVDSLGFTQSISSYFDRDASHGVDGFVQFIMSITEGANAMVLLDLIKNIPSSINYTYFDSYLKLLFFWVPRDIYEEKPLSFPQIAALYYEPQLKGFSLNATLIGEGYSGFGLLGLPLFFSFVIFILLIYQHIWNKLCRGLELNWFVPMIFSFLALRAGAISDIIMFMIMIMILASILKVISKNKARLP
jgi:hypothetical protein